MACSLFESTLTDLCKYLDGLPTQLGLPSPKRNGTTARLTLITRWEDVKGSGILRPAAFLRKNFRVEAGRYSAWNTILGHYEVRHCLAHANGDVGLMPGEQRKTTKGTTPETAIFRDQDQRLWSSTVRIRIRRVSYRSYARISRRTTCDLLYKQDTGAAFLVVAYAELASWDQHGGGTESRKAC